MKRFELLDLRRLNMKSHQSVDHGFPRLRLFRVKAAVDCVTGTLWRSSKRGTKSPDEARRSRPFHRTDTPLSSVRKFDSSSMSRSRSASFCWRRSRTVRHGALPARYIRKISANSRSVKPARFAEDTHLRYWTSCAVQSRYPAGDRSAFGTSPIRS